MSKSFNPTRRELLAAAVGVAIASSSRAQQTGSALQAYEVELVIFRHLGGGGTAEQWGLETGNAKGELAIADEEATPFTAAPAPAAGGATFPALPAAKFKLTAIEEALRRSRSYQPLAHIGWTQPGFARDAARYLPINTWVSESTGLKGQVALSRGRYLHLVLDLTYDSPSDGQRFVLRQTRRMRSNERHYIDHPKLGVIALVTPAASGGA